MHYLLNRVYRLDFFPSIFCRYLLLHLPWDLLRNNIERKRSKYAVLIKDQMKHFKTVKFVNLSVSALGVFDQESLAFIEMLKELNVDINHQKYILRKVINITIRSTYYIFCCRDKEWSNPDLMII